MSYLLYYSIESAPGRASAEYIYPSIIHSLISARKVVRRISKANGGKAVQYSLHPAC